MRGNRVHERRRKAVVGLEPQLLQPGADGPHLIRGGAGFDDRGDECGEFGSRPSLLPGKLGVDEIEPVERMLGVFDAAVHVNAASRAGVPLNRCIAVHDLQPVGVLADVELVARHDGDLREQGTCGLPASGTSAHMIVRGLRRDGHLDGIARTFAKERPTREVGRAGFYAIVHRRMN